jgi:uncharacterized cupredoxin-like copper-binding protein
MSNRLPKTIALVAMAVTIPVAAAGCGSSSTNNASANPTTTPASTQAAAATSGTVNVILNEMNVVPTPATAKAGKVTFADNNAGQLPHEMVVIKTDKKADALGSGTKVPETGSVGETGDIAPGKTKSVSFTLKPGHYALICNIAGHYAAGMHADFNVS